MLGSCACGPGAIPGSCPPTPGWRASRPGVAPGETGVAGVCLAPASAVGLVDADAGGLARADLVRGG
jgi:hypothetical protein